METAIGSREMVGKGQIVRLATGQEGAAAAEGNRVGQSGPEQELLRNYHRTPLNGCPAK